MRAACARLYCVVNVLVPCLIFQSGCFLQSSSSPTQGITPTPTPTPIVPVVLGEVPLANNPNLQFGLPINRTQKPEIFLSRPEYVISWNKNTRTLNWGAWTIEFHDLGNGHRTNIFMADKDLEDYLKNNGASAVTETDFSRSCFDRGHQIPSGDRTATLQENSKTFFMSNMLPQTAFLNRVLWEHLEVHERNMVKDPDSKIQIFAGPIYGAKPSGIGAKHDILIPIFNYKIIVPLHKGVAVNRFSKDIIVVKMPNVTSRKTNPVDDLGFACQESTSSVMPSTGDSANSWTQYKTTIEEVETLSGFSFFETHP